VRHALDGIVAAVGWPLCWSTSEPSISSPQNMIATKKRFVLVGMHSLLELDRVAEHRLTLKLLGFAFVLRVKV
jgi:hypothetical protein